MAESRSSEWRAYCDCCGTRLEKELVSLSNWLGWAIKFEAILRVIQKSTRWST